MQNPLSREKYSLGEIQVRYGLCHACGSCVGICPANALFLSSSHLSIQATCTRCGVCLFACPVGALVSVPRPVEAAR